MASLFIRIKGWWTQISVSLLKNLILSLERTTMASFFFHIKGWLTQPHVWRMVGFASTVVGLSCYVLSSSFNNLFGHCNLLKFILYTIFSVIISLAILLAKVWQYSVNTRFKAHVIFLVLTITSVYSFFYDKAVNKKPDAYGLISCGAFAIMSLSLSRQTHFGFEVELLYFFLGALIVQLMKVELWLGIIGAVFCYSLVILRSSLDSNGSVGHQDQHHLVIQVDTHLVSTPQQVVVSQHDDDSRVLIVQAFERALERLRSYDSKPVKSLGNRIKSYLTGTHDLPPVDLVFDQNFLIDQIPSAALEDFRAKVILMIDAGGLKEQCLDGYISWRIVLFEKWLPFLQLEKPTNYDMVSVMSWKKSSSVVIKILLHYERRLCDKVFSGALSSLADLSFTQLCRQVMDTVLSFANHFSIWMPSRDHLPQKLQVFKALRDLSPELDSLFSDPYSESIITKVTTATKTIGEAIRDHYSLELEHLIRHDTEQESVPGGIYPVTVQAMKSLGGVFQVRDTLELVFQDYPQEGMPCSLPSHMGWIIEQLETFLEAKSQTYLNHALRYVFMMNNVRYIGKIAQDVRLSPILGDDWILRQTAKVQRNLELYQRSSWDEVLGFLSLDGNEELNVTAESLIEKLRLFNMHFKDIWKVQCTWFVCDKELREEIIESLDNILLSAYGIFLGKCHEVLGNNAYKYIRYSLLDIQGLLKDLFNGKG